jgi:hypothetical protein
MLSSKVPLGLPRDLFPSGFPINILYAFVVSPMHVTRPVDLIKPTMRVDAYIFIHCRIQVNMES